MNYFTSELTKTRPLLATSCHYANLQKYLLKMMIFLRIKYLLPHGFIQKKVGVINIDELLDTKHKKLSRGERWMYKGSGWTINSMI